MKRKLTLEERLLKRHFKVPNPIVYNLLAKIVIFKFLAPKLNIHYEIVDDLSKHKGPAFLIFNHQSRMDYIWTIEASYPRRLNFVVGYNEFFRSHLKLILGIDKAIPKKNFTLDLPAMRAIDRIIKQGGIVAFSPEGMSSISGHNQPIVRGTGKLFKRYGIPVYLMKTKGAFLTNTKNCLDERPGKIEAKMTRLFSPEELASLSSEEVDQKIDEAIWQDDYEWNAEEKNHFKMGEHGVAHHLNDLLYRCPKCGKEFVMKDEGDTLYCDACHNGAKLDDTYALHKLHEDDVIPSSPSRWFDEERREIYREISANPNYSFSFEATLRGLPKYKPLKNMETGEELGKGTVTIDHKGVHYSGTKDGKPHSFDMNYHEIPTWGMPTDTSYVSFYQAGHYYEFIPDKPVVGKILLLVEELGRMHGSNWPNFPWMKWVYE